MTSVDVNGCVLSVCQRVSAHHMLKFHEASFFQSEEVMSSFVSIFLRLRWRPGVEKRNSDFNEEVVKILCLSLLVPWFGGKLDFISLLVLWISSSHFHTSNKSTLHVFLILFWN